MKRQCIGEKALKLIMGLLALLFIVLFFPKNIKLIVNMKETSQVGWMQAYPDVDGVAAKVMTPIFQDRFVYNEKVWGDKIKLLRFNSLDKIGKEDIESVECYYGSVRAGSINLSEMSTLPGNIIQLPIHYYNKRIVVIEIVYLSAFILTFFFLLRKIKKIDFAKLLEIKYWINRRLFAKQSIILSVLSGLIVFFLENIWNGINIHYIELMFLIPVFFIVILILSRINCNEKYFLLLSIPLFIVLYISENQLTTYLTVDESRAILEQTHLSTDILRHWELGSSRLNYIIMGTIWKLVPRNFISTGYEEYRIAKLFHWSLGILLIAYLAYYIVKKVLVNKDENVKAAQFTIIFTMITLSPVMLTILKNYNYDLFAVLFACIGTAKMIYAIKKEDLIEARYAVVIAGLATLEKTIAEPVMLIAMVTYVYLGVKKKESKILYSVFYSAKINTYVVGLSLICNLYIQHVLRGDEFANYKLENIIGPILDLQIKLIGKVATADNRIMLLIAFLITILMVSICAWCIQKWMCSIEKRKSEKKLNVMYSWLAVLTFIVFVIAIVGTYILRFTYYYPAYKQSEDIYMTYTSATAKIFHYNAHSIVAFYVKSCWAMIIVMVNSIPTLILVLLMLELLLFKKLKKAKEFIILIFIFGVMIPIMYGFICMEPNPRYQNLYIVLVSLCAVIILLDNMSLNKNWMYAIAIISTGTIVWEIVPFGPAYTGFFPIWNLEHAEYSYIESGKMSLGWYGGWGENISIAGKAITKYLEEQGIDYDQINMYTNYHGEWMTNTGKINVLFMPGSKIFNTGDLQELSIDDFGLQENTFYVFVRWGCIAGTTEYEMPPKEIEPIITINRRGATEIWIYKGEDLKQYFISVLEQNNKKIYKN